MDSRQLSWSVMFYARTMSGVLRLINREKKTEYYYVAHTDESPTRLRKWDQSIGPRAESFDEAIVEKRRGDNGAINRVMWGHFIELSMRSTLAYLRSMDTGTLLFERTLTRLTVSLPLSFFSLFLSLASISLPRSLWSPRSPLFAAFNLSIRVSFSLVPVNVRRLIEPEHPRRNKLSRPWHFGPLMSEKHAINPAPNEGVFPSYRGAIPGVSFGAGMSASAVYVISHTR